MDLAVVLALLAGVVAAIFAARGDFFSRSQATQGSRGRKRELQPRPRVRWMGHQTIQSAFYNVGGAAVSLIWVGYDGRGMRLYCTRTSLPQHFNDYMGVGEEDLGEARSYSGDKAKIETVLMVAQDVDGDWWDCLADRPIERPIAEYLEALLASVGLRDFAGRVFQVGKLDQA